MGDQEPEPDWEKNFSESFTKKIPFPMFKYEVCKFNPAKTDSMYTLATASVHDNTNFNLYTSADTKKELDEIVKELKEEDAKEIKEVKEETKEENKEEKKEGEGDAGGYQDEEQKKEKIKDSNDPVERALRILNNKRAEEKEANNIKHDRRESRKEDLDIPEPSLNKKASSMNKLIFK